MKLHLPKGLRSAVLACMTVVSGLATTVGTGIVTGGAMAIVFGGSQAMAAVTVDAEAKTVTVDGKGNTELNLAGYGADQTIIFQMDDANSSGESNNYFSGGNKTDVVAAAVRIVNTEAEGDTGFVISNGNANNYQVFTGAVTGDGILKKVGAGTGAGYVFEGDVTGFTGDITLSATANFSMTFGGRGDAIAAVSNTATTGVAGTGNITFGTDKNTLTFNYTDAVPVYITNQISKTGGTSKMVLKGGAAYTFTKSVAVDNFTLNAGSAAFNAEASLGAITLNIAALTEASAAMLNAGSNALTATSLTLNGSGGLGAGTYNIVQTTNDAAAALLALYTGADELVNEDGLIKLVVGSGAISVTSDMTIPTASQTSRGYDVSGGAKLTIGEGNTGAATEGSVWNYGPITVGDSNSEIKFHLWTTAKVNVSASDKAEVQSTISLADTAKLYFVDGSYYMSGDITVAEGAAAAIEMQYAKGVVLGSLKGAADSTVTLRRGQGDNAAGVFSLQGANEFAGTVVLDIYNGNANAVNWVVLNNAGALTNAAVNTGDDAAKNVLALNVAETSIRSLSGSGKIATYGAGLNSDGAGISAATLKVTAADGTFTGTVAAGITLDISGGVQTFDGGTYEGLVSVGADATLNVSGAITLGQAVQNAGTVDISGITGLTLGAAIVDAATVSGKVTTYTLVDGGTVTGLESATSDELKAAIVSDALLRPGTEWSVSNGALIITQTADNLVWSGGNITWKEGCTMDAGGVFDNNDFVDFTTQGALTATIEGDITAGLVTVAGGTDLTLAGSGSLTVGDTLTVGSDSAAGSLTIGTLGNNLKEVILNGDSKLIIDTDTSTTFGEALGEGTTITGGILGVGEGTTLTYDGGAFNSQRLDVAGELVISGCSLSSDINVSGKLVIRKGDAINYNASTTLTVDGGTVELGEYRQSFSANNKLVLNNGTITGQGDGYGALDFFQDGCKITSTGNSSIDAPLRLRNGGQTTTVDVVDGTLTISATNSNATLAKVGEGTLAISSTLGNAGGALVNAGTLKMLDGSSATSTVTLAGGSLTAEGTATMASLAGSGDITVAADGALTITNAAGLFNKKGSGSLTIDTMGGAELAMNYEGVLTINAFNLNENALLTYGNIPGGNLIKIDALTTAVAVNGFNLDLSADLELELGIASSVDSALISVSGLNSDQYQLVDDNGYWKLVVAGGTELDTDWDINWGAAGLAGAPTSLEATAVAADAGELFLNGASASLTGGNANVIVYGGTSLPNAGDATPYVGDVWIRADEGQYKAIVGGHWANTWGSGSVGNFNGNTHIILDGATVGSIVGGTMQDGRTPVFTGNSYISVFSGDVTAAIIGAGTNAHGNTSVFTGSTNIFVYVPLATNNTNNLDNTTSPGDAVIGGGSKVDSQNRNSTNTVNGSTNITIDLSAYTGTGTEFKKKVIGGHYNWAGNLTANINGDTNVTVTGKSGMTFTDMIVGGSRISGGAINTTGTSTVTISGGATMNSAVAAGSYLAGNFTSNIGNTVLNITGGTYGGNISGGSYVDASDATSNQGDSAVTITGGTFNGNVAGAAFLATKATTHTGDATLTATGSTFKGWVTGGVFTNSSTSTVTTGDVSMTLTDSSFSKLVAGGSFVGGRTSTNTIGDVSIVLDGVTLTEGLYGGVYQHAESSTSTVGDVTITLTGDGTISGNIWAAGGTAANAANITVASTTVKVADTVTFGSGAVLHGGFNKAATGNCVMTVTGSRSLIFTGDADQDRSTLSFEGFDTIGVETAGKTATVGAMTMTDAVTIDGAGTIKLAGAAAFGGGATVDAALDLNGQTVTGDVTVNGTLTSGGSAIAGTLTLADDATISDAASATNIAVGTYSNTVGLTATETITVGTQLSSSAALTAGKIAGEGSVEITGGTVTLSDTTDAFANIGATSIAGADLAGTWNADGVTIGQGTTVSGTVGLANSTIDGTITNSGTLTLSGAITLGSGIEKENESVNYSDGNNGYATSTCDYKLAIGGTTTADGVTWNVDGVDVAADKASFADGVLNIDGVEGNVYYVRDGEVSYDGGEGFKADTTALSINGGTLKLATSTVADGFITSGATGGALDLNGHSIAQSAIGTLEGAVEMTGAGTYDLGSGTTALSTNLSLGSGWTGTVQVSDAAISGMNLDSLANGGNSTVELSGVTGYFAKNGTYSANVALVGNGYTVNDGYNAETKTFNGAISGTGALNFTRDGSKSAVTQTFVFAGDTSAWSGDITHDCGSDKLTTNLKFTGTSAINNNISTTGGTLNLTVGGSSAVAMNGTVSVSSLSATTAVTAGTLSLSNGASTATDLTASVLTLGTDGSVATLAVSGVLTLGTTDAAGSLTLGNLGSGSLFEVGTLAGNFDLGIDDALLAALGNDASVVLGTAATNNAEMTFNGQSAVDGSWAYEFEGYQYTLGWNADGELVLQSRLQGNEWIGSTWTDADASDWAAGEQPAGDDPALFLGNGESTVTIEGIVTPGDVSVEIAGNATTKEYTFEGGTLEATGKLTVIEGKLTLDNEKTSFDGASEIQDGGELVIGSNGTADFNAGLANNGGTITMDGGALNVTGTLDNDGAVDIESGALSTDSLSNMTDGTITLSGGDLTVNRNVDNDGILTIDGGSATVAGNLNTEDGTLELLQGSLTVGGELTGIDLDCINEGMNLTVGTYDDGSDLNIEGSLTVTGDSAIGPVIALGENGSLAVDGGSLTTGELQFGELTGESEAKVSLSNGGTIGAPAFVPYTTGAADGVLITLDNAADSLVAGDEFRLVDGETSADGYYLADDYEQTVLLGANKAELLTDEAGMYLGVRELEDKELVWNTSDYDSVGGLHITTEADDTTLYHGYQTLDTIKLVNVDDDQTIDLSAMAPDDDADSLKINSLSGNGLLILKGNGDDRVTIGGGEMDGELALQNVDTTVTAPLTVAGLKGDADAIIGGSVTVTESAEWLGGYKDATIAVTNGAKAELVAATGLTVAGDKGTINLNYGSNNEISGIATTGADINLTGAPESTLTLTEASSMKGGSLNFGIQSSDLGATIIKKGGIEMDGTAVNVTQLDNSLVMKANSGVNKIADLGDSEGGSVTLIGKGFDKYFTNARVEGGSVVADRNESYASDKLAPTSANGAAGAAMLDATLVYENPQAGRDAMPDRAALLDAVDAGAVTDEELAAVAGSSIATMGMALSGDVERQLRAIRNRTTSMGVNECVVNEGMPYFNAWVNAEGNRADLDKDGTLAGYTMDSWGGTVGFDVDFDPNFTAGLAITAMYGNLTADGPETKAEGDMDTYYVTLFARYAKSAWTHTFVGTFGMMDGSFDRTVTVNGRQYETEGDTDGMSFGLMYEVGYVMPLDEDATACLQPIFNVMLRHASVGSYTEKGSDAALEVDAQSMTTLTFGLGARLQAVVGESLYNRASIFEARALVKADVGDRSSEADVAFVGSKHSSAVESAELGVIGVELGAGLIIPVGDDDGSIFIDGAVELRSGYTNVNGTVGYRINF